MNIAFFTDNYLPQIDGISVHVDEICSQLAKKGHSILLFAPQPSDKRKHLPLNRNFKIHYLPSIPIGWSAESRIAFPFFPDVTNTVKNFKPDIIHFHTSFMVGFQGILLAKTLNVPLIGTFHTYFMEPEYLQRIGLEKVKLDKNKFINQMGWNYANFFYNKVDTVISPSHFTKSDLHKNGLTVPIKVISNGIDYTRLIKSNLQKRRFKLPEKYFLYVGRVSVEKSLDKLIRAFAKVATKDKTVDLVIAGDGGERKSLEVLVAKLNITKRVQFLGMIPHDEIVNSNLLPSALAFVTASKSEIQPLSLLEAMCFGLPIVAVNARGIPELVKENGILCKPDSTTELSDAMLKLLNNTDLRQKLSKVSLKLAQKNSIENTSQELAKLYQSVKAKKLASTSR